MTATRSGSVPVRLPGARVAAGPGVGDVLVAIALLVVAAFLRAGPLTPSSLWIDDAWIGLVTRADGLGDVWLVGVTAPGFALLLAGVLGLVGFSEGAALALPFALGVAGPTVLYLAARALRLHQAAALVGAGILLTAPELLTYATRVKHYTAEVVLAVLLLAVAVAVVRRPARGRRWAALAALAIGGVVVSSAVAVTAGAAVAAGGLAALRATDRRAALRPALAFGGAVSLFVPVWAALVVGPRTTDTLRDYWDGFYSLRGVTGVLEGLLPLPAALGAVLLGAAAVVVVRRDPALGVLLAGPLALAGLLAVAGQAPLGGGRTDLHLYPSLAMLVAVALDTVLPAGRRTARAPALAAALAVTGLVVLTPGPEPYFAEDVAPLIETLETSGEPDDLVVVFPPTRWAYALYTSRPVSLRPDPVTGTGFDVEIGAAAPDPELVVLPDELDDEGGLRLLDEPGAAGLDALAGAERVWLLRAHARPESSQAVEELLARQGLRPARVEARDGADLALWTRRPPTR
jgi:hypothetical protein